MLQDKDETLDWIVLGLFERFNINFIHVHVFLKEFYKGQPSILAFPRNGWGFVATFFPKEEKWENIGFFVK